MGHKTYFTTRPIDEEKLSRAKIILGGRLYDFYDLFYCPDPGSIDQIVNIVTSFTGITMEQIKSETRVMDVVYARMILSYHLIKLMPCKEVGAVINKAYSSVLHQIQKYHDEKEVNKWFRELAERIKNEINSIS